MKSTSKTTAKAEAKRCVAIKVIDEHLNLRSRKNRLEVERAIRRILGPTVNIVVRLIEACGFEMLELRVRPKGREYAT
jgi:hypothetical protein